MGKDSGSWGSGGGYLPGRKFLVRGDAFYGASRRGSGERGGGGFQARFRGGVLGECGGGSLRGLHPAGVGSRGGGYRRCDAPGAADAHLVGLCRDRRGGGSLLHLLPLRPGGRRTAGCRGRLGGPDLRRLIPEFREHTAHRRSRPVRNLRGRQDRKRARSAPWLST